MAHFEHGAIDKETSRLVDPISALQRHPYECPDCHRTVHVKKGSERVAHFAHNPDPSNPCTYYFKSASLDQRHKNAQLKLKQFLERGREINIARACECGCRVISHWGITCRPSTTVRCEHRFVFKESNKSADVAVLDQSGELICIFEVVHTHYTREAHRPEPWHEIRADEINAIPSDTETIQLRCIRQVYRPECLARQAAERRAEEERQQQRERQWREERERRIRREAIAEEENRQRLERWREEKRLQDEADQQVPEQPRVIQPDPEHLTRQRIVERQRDEKRKRQQVADEGLQQWMETQKEEKQRLYKTYVRRVPPCMLCMPSLTEENTWTFGRCSHCNQDICARVDRDLKSRTHLVAPA